jgi:hypothetical protein
VRYTVAIGDLAGELDVSEKPYCTLGSTRYTIRTRKTSGGWGEPQFDCDVAAPNGDRAYAGASPREGVGVSLGGGESWSLACADEGAYVLGDAIRVARDDAAGTLSVTGPVPPGRIPHVIAGLVLIVHPDS